METIGILLAVVLGLPALIALGTAGFQGIQAYRRERRWQAEASAYFDDEEAERKARALLAWCDARQAPERLGLGRPADGTCVLPERPNFIAPEAFNREAFRYSLGHQQGQAAAAGHGFASVHLLLNDGAGHFFRVERRLCLN